MNYLARIKRDLEDFERQQGLRSTVVVDRRALTELIADYERFDMQARGTHPPHMQRLTEAAAKLREATVETERALDAMRLAMPRERG